MLYTHAGYRPHVGHRNSGRLYGHDALRPGKTHALTGGPTVFTAACGEAVVLETRNEYGDEAPPNIHEGQDGVDCARCRRLAGLARYAARVPPRGTRRRGTAGTRPRRKPKLRSSPSSNSTLISRGASDWCNP